MVEWCVSAQKKRKLGNTAGWCQNEMECVKLAGSGYRLRRHHTEIWRERKLFTEKYTAPLKKKFSQIQCLSPTCWFQLPFFLLFTLYAKLFLIWGSGSVQNLQHVTPTNHKEHSLLLFNKIHQYLRLVKQESALILTFIIQQTSYISTSK